MSAEEKYHEFTNVSKQITKVTPLFAKLVWCIENFEMLMRLSKQGRVISSEMFTYPCMQSVKWQLDVYPNGMADEKIPSNVYQKSDYKSRPCFFLHEIGPQKSECIVADFKIYALCSNEENIKIHQGIREFAKDKKEYGTNVDKAAIAKAYYEDGSLLLICEVEFLAPEETYSMAPLHCASLYYPTRPLLRHIENMWRKQLCTDCNLQVGSKNFPAHKCILSEWSKVFRSMFSHPTVEAESGIVVISDFSSESVGAMLEYMYTGQVKIEVMNNLNTELLALADKYALYYLKQMCEVFTASMIDRTNVLDAAVVADMHLSEQLKMVCANQLVMHGREVLDSPLWKELTAKNNNLARELLELVIRDHPSFSDIEGKKDDKTI